MLSDFFEGVGSKYLSEVEINSFRSNQHEFQGINTFRRFLGTTTDSIEFNTTFFLLSDNEEIGVLSLKARCTWYDARLDHPTRSEYRLYYDASSNSIVGKALAGDLLVVAKKKTQELLIIICPSGSTVEQQILWLFGIQPAAGLPAAKPIEASDGENLTLAARSILETLGIPLDIPQPDDLEELLALFGGSFPSTAEFSQHARTRAVDIDAIDDPDEALVSWMEQEEILFRHLEKQIISERLAKGFVSEDSIDVEGFIQFSLSVQNRRKSRAGWALGNHVEELLKLHHIRYKREARTELKKKPDFLFPGEKEYHDSTHDINMLTMLGAKTTCKERWRQVLTEAGRIKFKHLLTLEPAISVDQTNEMKSEQLQLVVPSSVLATYTTKQRDWLVDVGSFLTLVKNRQKP